MNDFTHSQSKIELVQDEDETLTDFKMLFNRLIVVHEPPNPY